MLTAVFANMHTPVGLHRISVSSSLQHTISALQESGILASNDVDGYGLSRNLLMYFKVM